MSNIERDSPDPWNPADLDIPTLQTALQSSPHPRLDGHLGSGVVFPLGADHQSSLEIYDHAVRFTFPDGQLILRRREAEHAAEGVIFHDPDRFVLSVGPHGDVLFQYSPTATTDGEQRALTPIRRPTAAPSADSPAPAPEATEKAKSERYVGRLGEVRMHTTRQGKVVAEVELTVPDPDHPGASMLVKFAAFGEKAEALKRDYSPGQDVVAVGIPHTLRRRGKAGQEWVERQVFFVQLPKVRGP